MTKAGHPPAIPLPLLVGKWRDSVTSSGHLQMSGEPWLEVSKGWGLSSAAMYNRPMGCVRTEAERVILRD